MVVYLYLENYSYSPWSFILILESNYKLRLKKSRWAFSVQKKSNIVVKPCNYLRDLQIHLESFQEIFLLGVWVQTRQEEYPPTASTLLPWTKKIAQVRNLKIPRVTAHQEISPKANPESSYLQTFENFALHYKLVDFGWLGLDSSTKEKRMGFVLVLSKCFYLIKCSRNGYFSRFCTHIYTSGAVRSLNWIVEARTNFDGRTSARWREK
jgi:hypothetical protein